MNYFKEIKKLLNNPSRFLLFLSVFTTCYFSGEAQKVITLPDAINSAFQNRKYLIASRTDEDIRRLQTEILYRKYWPKVNAEYTYLYNPILQTSILPIGIFNPTYTPDATKNVQFGTKWNQTAGITLNQPILDVSVSRQISEAKLNEKIMGQTQAQNEYEVAYTVAQTYMDIIVQESCIRSAMADTQRTWVNYILQKNRFEEQRLLKTELNKSVINHLNAIQQFKNAVAQLIEDKVYFLFLIGENISENPDFEIDTVFQNVKKLKNIKLQTAAENIPEIKKLEMQSELGRLQTKTEKAKYIPTIGLKEFYGANQFTNNFQPLATNTWYGFSYVGIDIKYPVLIGENKRKILQQLDLQSKQYLLQKEEKLAYNNKEAVIAKIKMDNLATELKTKEENIKLTVETLSILQDRFSEGQESASSLNNEEINLQQLYTDYSTSQKQYWTLYIDYLKLTGNLQLLWK